MGSGDVSFDKVFSVPQVPGNGGGIGGETITDGNTDSRMKSTESSDDSVDEQKDSDEKEGNFKWFRCNTI